MKRTIAPSIVALFLVLAVVVVPTSRADKAHAASLAPITNTTHCASLGNRVENDPIKDGSTVLGYLQVYYNSSTSYNCAKVTSTGIAYGTSKFMHVVLDACKETAPNNSSCTVLAEDEDFGDYLYYAGPVGVYGKGHCISAYGSIQWKGVYHSVLTNPFTGHCS